MNILQKPKRFIGALITAVFVGLLLIVPHTAFAQSEGDGTDLWRAAWEGDICSDIKDAVPIIECGEKDVVSFSGFKGGLSAPTGEGLDESLTRARTAREFLVNTVNFILTFLGVVAMIVVIYGGFLYVTAAGNEEQSGKGKKSITYAIIGIFIIIGSFALVNTLLRFGGTAGDGTAGGTRGVGIDSTNIGQQAIYSRGAEEINAALNSFIDSYKKLARLQSLSKRVKTLKQPFARPDYQAYWNEAVGIVTEIRNTANQLSKTRIATQNFLDGWVAETVGKGITSSEFENGKLKVDFDSQFDAAGISAAITADFTAAIDELIAPESGTKPAGKLLVVRKVLGEIANLPAGTAIGDAQQRGLITDKDISRAFAGIDPNTTVNDVFNKTIGDIDAARALTTNPNNTELVINVVKSLDRLYLVVKDIRFVFVKINASAIEGSAPFSVELNGLDSRDPTGETIPDGKYAWDPDGDGRPGISSAEGRFPAVECNRVIGPTITCTYHKTGTYLVNLAIESTDPVRIARGEAFRGITVKPSVSRISLKATVGAVTTELKKYEQDSAGQWQRVIDLNELQVTTSEAKENGVSFDASESKSGEGGELTFFKWIFGDGTAPEEGAGKNKIDKHKYAREGKFPLSLEVTDTGNRKDRTIINVVIASIAARIEASDQIGEPEQIIEFDGSLSRSDGGPITNYTWAVLNSESKDVINFQNDVNVVGDKNGAVLRVRFKKPGKYRVQLKVSDGSRTGENEAEVSITSRKPRANFAVLSCPQQCSDPSIPSLVQFDASASFDPDRTDELTYIWSFFTETGDEIKAPTGFTLVEGKLEGKDAKKLKVKFPRTGGYTARLLVNDSHTDAAILQEDTKEKDFEIASIVEVSLNRNFIPVKKLENGVAPFVFEGTVRNADRIKIEYGDSLGSDETSVELNQNGEGTFRFEHDYAQAGSFLVNITALSEEGKGENTMRKRVYVGRGDTPLAVIEVSVDKIGIVLPEATPGNPTPALEIIRNKAIRFDATHSLSSSGASGTAANLAFSWNFGDNKRSSGAAVEHSYQDISPESSPYKITLTVTEKDDSSKTNEATFYVHVVSKQPTLHTLSLEKQGPGNETPVDVKLTAEGATDPDGRITNYQFWYFNPADREQKLGVVDTQSNTATLTVETAGEAEEEHEYLFCVRLTDNENTVSECDELFGDDDELPRLKVKNGPNKAPVASFSVDRTTVQVNDPVTFTSSSTDEDGRIIQYIWDLDGDGFHNDNPTDLSSVTHRYERKSPRGGYRVKLKVIDDKNAAGFSREVPVFVETKSRPPVAKFAWQVQSSELRRVKFFDESTADTANDARLVKWTWDFDTSQEFSFICTGTPKPVFCNNNKADDADSTDQNPIFDFPASGTYQVKLTVEDSDGNVSLPLTTIITVSGGSSGGAGTPDPNAQVLNAELSTHPASTFVTIPNTTPPLQQKVVRIPANENGRDITFFWGKSTGDIIEYSVDKNIYCDSDEDGNRVNDMDNPPANTCVDPATNLPATNCWQTNFQRFARTGDEPGNFTTQLTVTDRNGNISKDTVKIMFEGETDRSQMSAQCNPTAVSTLGASLFRQLGQQKTILLGIVAGVIVVLIGYGTVSYLQRGKRRNF